MLYWNGENEEQEVNALLEETESLTSNELLSKLGITLTSLSVPATAKRLTNKPKLILYLTSLSIYYMFRKRMYQQQDFLCNHMKLIHKKKC